MNENKKIIKGVYSVEFVVHDRKKFIWEVVDNHVV